MVSIDSRNRCWLLFLVLAVCAAPSRAGVKGTAHDLSAPGLGKDGRETNPCYFCHTPHNGVAPRALWNRSVPGHTYKLYESATLKATLNQPTGASRLCLSCHDGTIALDEDVKKPRPKNSGSLAGKNSLGTDLSDDHPISFRYDSALAGIRGELLVPALLPSNTALDETGQLQCTTCHDAHEDRNPKFLVMDNRFSRLCLACHQMKGWSTSVHALSTATWSGIALNPWEHTDYKTVAENSCANCHHVHSAGRPEGLLNFEKESKNCLACHNGSSSSKDVVRDFRKFSAHPVEQSESLHSPMEDPRGMSRHVACSDCHNPHAVQAAPGGNASQGTVAQAVKGVNSSGGLVQQATFQYEICYSCHGLSEQSRSILVRKDNVTNVRLQFDPGNQSYHPVVAPGKNQAVSGFEPGHSPSDVMQCTDCHNSDTSNTTKGPHGSSYEPILERGYQIQDPTPESYMSYSLCYKCHNRATLLTNQSAFPHKLHVVDRQAPCAVCHDAHGSRSSFGLINFMLRGKTGNTVVSASKNGRLDYLSLGPSRGQCSLSCHGSDHDARQYPPLPKPPPARVNPKASLNIWDR